MSDGITKTETPDFAGRAVEALLDAVAARLDKRAREIVADVAVLAPDRQIESTAQRLARDAVEDFADSIRSGRDGDELRALLAAAARPAEPRTMLDSVLTANRDEPDNAQVMVTMGLLRSCLPPRDEPAPVEASCPSTWTDSQGEAFRCALPAGHVVDASDPRTWHDSDGGQSWADPAPPEVRGVVIDIDGDEEAAEITVRVPMERIETVRAVNAMEGQVVRIVPGGGR